MGILRRGFDASWSLPSAQKAYDVGYRVAMRYLSHDPSKNLTAAEVATDHAVGIDVGLNWETTTNATQQGFAAGAADATAANQQADALGAPQDVCIYYSTDTFATADQVRPYYQGANSVNRRPVGGYGGSVPLLALLNEGVIKYWWQANAGSWSGFQTSNFPTHPQAHMRQLITATLPDAGGSIDENEIMAEDCGLWLSPKNASTKRSAAPPLLAHSHEEGPMAIAVYPKDPTRTDGVDLGADGKLYHWARNNMSADIIHPEEWPVAGPTSPLVRVSWCQWRPDSSGMWCAVVDQNGQAWISLMQGNDGSFSPFTQLTGVPLKV